ncbi:hypothetical protein ACN28S_51035 [Cystobacter fuscus]
MSTLEAEPSLPAPACIPWPYASPPVQATACEVSSVLADGRGQHARYDADSRLLELRTNDASGATLSVETHTWWDGLELRSRVDHAGGTFEQTDWTYDEQRRLLMRVTQGVRSSSTEYEYNDQGGLYCITTRNDSDSRLNYWSEYSYDQQGRLTGIDTSGWYGCGSGEQRCASLSYWPNGQLKRHQWYTGYYQAYADEYNERGQLISSSWDNGTGECSSESTRAYDTAGRALRLREHRQCPGRVEERLTTTVHDPGGWRERFAEDIFHYKVCTGEACGPTQLFSTRRITHRARFICGTSIVALDEWDMNEDGVVDARRTHERDSTGRLVHEEYSGTPGLDDGPVRRDFNYDCP